MAKDNQEPKNQPPAPSQPAENPKPPVNKLPPEIRPDESTILRFQGSEDLRPNPNLIQLNEKKKE